MTDTDEAELYRKKARLLRKVISVPALVKLLGLGTGTKLTCLWHKDKTPSLQVYPDKLQCYGQCARAYSAIDLVRHQLEYTFQSAIDWLVETFNVTDDEASLDDDVDISAIEKFLWHQAEKRIALTVRPYILRPPLPVYDVIENDIWKAYAIWDRLREKAMANDEPATKVVLIAAKVIQEYLLGRAKLAIAAVTEPGTAD